MSYCSRSRRRQFTVLVFKSWAYSLIYGHFQQHLYCPLATFSVDFLHFICRMSAIFLLPVCLTYWHRKYTTHVDPHVYNFHQVWSPTPIRCWFMSDNVSPWLPLKMRTRPLRMRRITWPVSRGSKTISYLESLTPICLFTIQLLLGYDDD